MPVRMSNNPRVCYECGSPDHFRNTYPKMNRAQGQAGKSIALSQPKLNNGNQVRGRSLQHVNVNAMDAVQGESQRCTWPILVFHITEFAPLTYVRKPSIVNPGYVIEVADGKKVEVDRIICD
ncbi:hypothetical protein Tco_0596185 [Tanacetum coccineum]